MFLDVLFKEDGHKFETTLSVMYMYCKKFVLMKGKHFLEIKRTFEILSTVLEVVAMQFSVQRAD